MRWTVSLALALLLSASAAGQSKPTDSPSLEGIQGEIRQLRQDLRALLGGAQRAQILIARVQLEEAVVKGVQERIDTTRTKLAEIQSEERQVTLGDKQIEESLSQTDNPAKRKQIEEALARSKVWLEERARLEQEAQAKLTEAEEQLRLELAKLGRLQDQLDRLDKAMEEASQR